MKIIDMHIHTDRGKADSEALLNNLERAGVWGGAVFSPPPEGYLEGASYEERIVSVLDWTRNYPERLFPILWIHPHEKDAISKAKDAACRGIKGFKIICNDFYVYEPACMELLNRIAELGKPVCFHSGILWDGMVSSRYNEPLNWESLLEIPRLRFSLAHCSWPWYDACIALYGKFLNAYMRRPELSSEMFFDLTPGTPVPYRRDLLTKLFTVGYDVEHNILFGTDCTAQTYNWEWSRQWIDRDNGIYDELGINETIREQLYADNYLRFLGISTAVANHVSVAPDGTRHMVNSI